MRLAAAFLADAGRAAYRLWSPLVAGIAVVASVLFAPQGMTARDAVLALEGLWPLRLGLFAGWVLAAAPATRLLFGTPPTLYLRSLAPARAFIPAVALPLLVAELPYTLLFARGGGPLAGAAALAAAAAAHAALAGRLYPLAALVAAAVVLLPPAPRGLACAVALLAAAPAAWRAAAMHRAPSRPLVGGGRLSAVASAHLLGALRGAPAALARAAIVIAAGGALTALVARNNQLEGRGLAILSLAMGAPILVVALGGLAGALLAAEGQAAWLLASLGITRDERSVARAAAAAAAGLVAGVAYGSVAAPVTTPACGLLGALVGIALIAGRRP